MKKLTLKLVEFYTLDVELNGIKSPINGEVTNKGLLQEKLPLKTKFWLADLAKKVSDIKALAEVVRQDLIKKYGQTQENGSITIPQMIKNPEKETELIVNPDFKKFSEEFDAFLAEEREIEHRGFTMSEFESVESDATYWVFFKFIDDVND